MPSPQGNMGPSNGPSGFKSPGGNAFQAILNNVKAITKDFKELRKEAELWKKAITDGVAAMGTGSKVAGQMGLYQGFSPGISNQASLTETLGKGAMLAGAMAFSMMPSAGSAVAQQIGAQRVASFSGRGITAASVMSGANALNRGGFTSATSMTEAAGALFSGGYTFASRTAGQNLSQLGGMSVVSGMSNESVAAGIANINGMNFLRIGIRARNSDGSLRPINQIASDLFRRMYPGRNPSPEQVAAVLRPNSNAYRTIATVAGGDPNLMGQLQMAIMAQAKNGGRTLDTSDPGKMMNLMGLSKDDPQRAAFNYNSAQAKLAEVTNSGLVAGYSGALNTSASITNQFADLAKQLGPVTEMFGRLKGFLETLPEVNGGAQLSTLGGMGLNAAAVGFTNYRTSVGIQRYAAQAAAYEAAIARGATPAQANAAAARAGGGLVGGGAKFAKAGGLALGAVGAHLATDALHSKFGGKNRTADVIGLTAARAGEYALAGAGIGALFGGVGAPIGATIGALAGGAMGYMEAQGIGGGDDTTGQVSMNSTGSSGYQSSDSGTVMPVPGHSRVNATYGQRGKAWKRKGYHTGVDYDASIGDPVVATKAGVVFNSNPGSGYGICVQINHGDGTSTLYGHLSKKIVKVGQRVAKGQVIGYVGQTGNATGPHLHFEVRKGSQDVNPSSFLSGAIDTVVNAFNSVKSFFTGSQSSGKPAAVSSSGAMLSPLSNLSAASIAKSQALMGTGVLGVNDLLGTGIGSSYWSSFSGSSSTSSSSSSEEEVPSYQTPGRTDNNSGPSSHSNSRISPPRDFSESKNVPITPAPDNHDSFHFEGKKKEKKSYIPKTENSPDLGLKKYYQPSERLSKEQLIKLLAHNTKLKGVHIAEAYAIAMTESGGRPAARLPVGQRGKHDPYGLFQINLSKRLEEGATRTLFEDRVTSGRFSRYGIHKAEDYLDPVKNAKVADHFSTHGKNWSDAWSSSYRTGRYNSYLPSMQEVNKILGIGGGDFSPSHDQDVRMSNVRSLREKVSTATTQYVSGYSGANLNSGNTVNVNITLNVANATELEAVNFANKVKRILEQDLKYGQIGAY